MYMERDRVFYQILLSELDIMYDVRLYDYDDVQEPDMVLLRINFLYYFVWVIFFSYHKHPLISVFIVKCVLVLL